MSQIKYSSPFFAFFLLLLNLGQLISANASSISPSGVFVDRAGGEAPVLVSASYAVTNTNSWITINSSNTFSTGTNTFFVATNDSGFPRTGFLTIGTIAKLAQKQAS